MAGRPKTLSADWLSANTFLRSDLADWLQANTSIGSGLINCRNYNPIQEKINEKKSIRLLFILFKSKIPDDAISYYMRT